MSDSKAWALDELAKANTIFEPSQRDGWTQAVSFLFWCLECSLIWYVAAHFVAS